MPNIPNRQWRLISRPQTNLTEANFEFGTQPVDDLVAGEVLVKNELISLDPSSRVWTNARESYMPPVIIGDVMRSINIGTVVRSLHPKLVEGNLVTGLTGWQDYAVVTGDAVSKLPSNPEVPHEAYLAVLSHIGLTAYFGLTELGKPKSGETLVVSAAAGAVGSLAGQIGKQLGLRVVGIAGTDEKCAWITRDLGFDAAINYKTQNVATELRKACPKGIDVDFENVGGEILNAVLGHINLHARIVLCGYISTYNADKPQPGPGNIANMVAKRARMEGFIVTDYLPRAAEGFAALGKWLADGSLKYAIDWVDGLERTPTALNRLFDGANTGKLIVRV